MKKVSERGVRGRAAGRRGEARRAESERERERKTAAERVANQKGEGGGVVTVTRRALPLRSRPSTLLERHMARTGLA